MALLVLAAAAAITLTPASVPSDAPISATGVARYDAGFFADMRPNTAKDMIARLPGFTFKDVNGGVRGFAGVGGNVLFDGDRPTTKNERIDQLLARIPAGQVDHIEVIRGGAPGVDMQGQGVVANVVLKPGASATGAVQLGDQLLSDGRQAPSLRVDGARRWDGRRLELSAQIYRFADDGAGDGPTVRLDPEGVVIRRSDLKAAAGGEQGMASVAYETPLAGGRLRLGANTLVKSYDDAEDDTLDPGPGVEFLRYSQARSDSEIDLHYERPLGSRLGLEILALQQYDTQDNVTHFFTSGEARDADDLFDERDSYGETVGRAVVRYRPSDRLTLEAATEGAFNWLDVATRYDEDGVPVDLPAANVRVAEKRGEVSGQATWQASDRVTVEAGLRAEASAMSASGDASLHKTLAFPKPRLVLTWSLDGRSQLRLRGEREVGQLNFRDFVASSSLDTGSVQAGNPDLAPQTAWVGEASFERSFGDAGTVSVTWRHSLLQNVIDRAPIVDPADPANVFDAPGNIGAGQGDDLAFALTLPLDRFGLERAQLKGDGTLRWSSVTDPTTGATRRISGQRPWDFAVHFTHDLPALRANWGIDLYNRWSETWYRFNEVDRYAMKTYISLYSEYKPQPNLAFRASIDNLAGRGSEREIQAYGGPRNTSALLYTDYRYQDVGPSVSFRVRRTFGE